MALRLILLIFLSAGFYIGPIAYASELYRYQDSNGRWVFGDKKSLGNDQKISKKAERINIKATSKKTEKPDFAIIKTTNIKTSEKSKTTNNPIIKTVQQWQITNPLPVDVQHWLRVKGEKFFFTSVMAMPFQTLSLNSSDYELEQNHQPVEHFYLLGKPIKKPDEQEIPLPYLPNKQYRISQGFKGVYSHTGRGNVYAVDIAMPIGAYVAAVKTGVVADLRDDFSMGGPTNYFLDKANHVTVMHDDGSYAIYAHILYGSAAVEIGDVVKEGNILARVGNTGFSTGPHLHFVLRYNSGRGTYSIPFKFTTNSGAKRPTEGKYYTAQ